LARDDVTSSYRRPEGRQISTDEKLDEKNEEGTMTEQTLEQLTLDGLRTLVAGDTVAIRGTAKLEPAGGPGDKIFPPSHSVDEKKPRPGAKYASETRRIDGRDVECVLVDSVQSQANRMEEALQILWADKQIALPVIAVDFTTIAPDVGLVTSLSAPHRVADALLRDSLLSDGTFFRMSEIGRSFTDATAKNAGPLFKVCPTALVFGLWDSTGPKGGLGSKFARALVGEIVGVGAVFGTKTASRIDPTGIVTASGVLYIKSRTEGELVTWTLAPDEALKDGVEPLKWGSKKDKNGKWKQGSGKPSEANHSNIPPTIDELAGGVTIDYAAHTVVLSLAAIRKLSFGTGDAEARKPADLAARTVLAALGLLAVLAAESRGHDLRSRCLLVPKQEEGKNNALRLETVGRDGKTGQLALDLDGAITLFNEAVGKLPEALRFSSRRGEPLVTLTPSPKLAHLVTKSRELAAVGADVEAD
jgi:CRISPR-associated protein Csb1